MAQPMSPLKSAKANLRKAVRASLKSLSEKEVLDQSSKIHQRLFALPEYQRAQRVSIYLSMPSGEVVTKPIIFDALRHGKAVFVPYIYGNTSTGHRSLMDMVELRSEDDFKALKPDKWGIPSIDPASVAQRARCLSESFEDKPEHYGPSARRENLDLIVMPGVAFDRTRHRLGHGKGYYDIFLSQYREYQGSDTEDVSMPYLVGLALDQQILPDGESLPVDASDWALDALLGAEVTIP